MARSFIDGPLTPYEKMSMASPVDMIVVLFQMVCVIIVVAQVVTSSRILREPLILKSTWRNALIIGVIFGLLSIYGTYTGFEFLGAKINVRDLAPMIAGLIAGPFGGIIAGLIGSLQRYSLGGITAVPCSIATILAGLIGGLIYLRFKRHFCGVKVAVVFAVLMECLHMLLILLLVQPFSVAWEIVSVLIVPMVLANAIGMAAFSIIVSDFLLRQKNTCGNEEKKTEKIN